MSCRHRAEHPHQHGKACGHVAVHHAGHVDYLHDGCLHHPSAGEIEEHIIPVTAQNPAGCTPGHPCNGHGTDHQHGPDLVTKRSLTGITPTTWWTAICTTRMATTAIIMGPST